jgi:hypothetical protein
MKCEEAMASLDKAKWEQKVEAEHGKMATCDVLEPFDVSKIPQDAKILTSSWAMKKKTEGACRSSMTARGFEQVDR